MRIVDAKDFAPDFIPVCPYCERELDTVVRLRDEKGFLQTGLGSADYSSS